MGWAFSILGVLFVCGFLLFLILILFMAASTKGGGGLGARPVLTAFLFAFAIVLMAGPAITLTLASSYTNEHAFRMFFGRQPGSNVKFINNASGGGADYSRVMLSFELGRERKFETFAASAHLKRAQGSAIPEVNTEPPDWWSPGDCPSPPAVYVGAADVNWDEKWATYCDDNRRVHAYALWIERDQQRRAR
ncbi:MAG: hypothetical protein HXY21_14095 [Parvularculaceae bacterium]|nr:hypothetical protein [Parvularculaceae bacterium]